MRMRKGLGEVTADIRTAAQREADVRRAAALGLTAGQEGKNDEG